MAGSFENQFDEFSSNSAKNILNKTRDAISEKFCTKLQTYKSAKLSYLTSKPGKDVFHHDMTVYTGSAGLALYYLISSLGKNDDCDDILKNALQYVELNNLKRRRISFLCGDAGPLAIATVISNKLGERRPDTLPHYENLVQRLINLSAMLEDSPDELLYGKVGYLYAILFVNRYVNNGKALISASHIKQITTSILNSGKKLAQQMKSRSPLLWQWHDKIYLGAAHGIAGILYMLLQVECQALKFDQSSIFCTNINSLQTLNAYNDRKNLMYNNTYIIKAKVCACLLLLHTANTEPTWLEYEMKIDSDECNQQGDRAREYIDANDVQNFIKPTLDWLLSLQFPSGNYPSSLGSSSGDRLVQWCHGAPGVVSLCTLAHKVFKEEKYLNNAIKCGDVIWQRGLVSKGYSLCHGVSGNAYAFLQLYQATKQPLHLYRACCLMEWCVGEHPGTEKHQPDRPASLFEGLLGRIYLAEDIMNPLQSRFPAFCL